MVVLVTNIHVQRAHAKNTQKSDLGPTNTHVLVTNILVLVTSNLALVARLTFPPGTAPLKLSAVNSLSVVARVAQVAEFLSLVALHQTTKVVRL